MVGGGGRTRDPRWSAGCGRPVRRVEEWVTWASRTRKRSDAGCGRPEGGGGAWAKTVKRPPQQPAQPRYANYGAPLTHVRHIPHSPGTPTTGLRERGNDTSKSTGRSSRQNAAPRRSTRSEERVTVQGPVKKQQPDGMSHGGGGGALENGVGSPPSPSIQLSPPPPPSQIVLCCGHMAMAVPKRPRGGHCRTTQRRGRSESTRRKRGAGTPPQSGRREPRARAVCGCTGAGGGGGISAGACASARSSLSNPDQSSNARLGTRMTSGESNGGSGQGRVRAADDHGRTPPPRPK